MASGNVTIGSCNFDVQSSNFPLGQGPQAGDKILIDPCQVSVDDGHLIAGARSSTSPTIVPNKDPVVVNDTASTDTMTPIPIAVLANDSDPDGDPLTVTSVTQPAHGTVTTTNTTVTYTPASTPLPRFRGTDTFTYTVSDGQGGAATATVIVTIRNKPPIAVNDMASTSEDTPVTIAVLANDSDPDGDPLTVTSVTQPTNGTVVNNGTTVTYTPNANFNGTDTFSYTVSDGQGGSATAMVMVSVNVPCTSGSLVEIPARPADSRSDVFTSTGIQVQDGDLVSITASRKASRQWDVGAGPVGPDGDGRGPCAGCPVKASLGALIGRIGRNGHPFLVGSQATIGAEGSDVLFLTSNDNTVGTCSGFPGSCYDDNRGTQQACVTVERGPVMTSTFDQRKGTLSVFRRGQVVVVYERDTQPGIRSIANAITQLYAVGHPGDNLLSDVSPLVPPQILVGVQDNFIRDVCSNDLTSGSCDYFVHHNPIVDILKASGSAVIFRIRATATQHDDQKTPIAYSSDMTITVRFHPIHTVVEYDVQTSLTQPVAVRHALRPLPFYELLNNPYDSVKYLDANCQDVVTVPIPTTGPDSFTFLQTSSICNDRPWAAIHHNDKGNLGMILQFRNWSSGAPELVSFTETKNHPREPNLYFQSTDNSRVYQSGTWRGRLIFLAYTNAQDHTPVQQFRDMLNPYTLLDDATQLAQHDFVPSIPVDIVELDPPPTGVLTDPGLVFEEYNAIRGDKYFDDHIFALETRPRGNVFRQLLQIVNRNVSPPQVVPYILAHYDYSAPVIQPPLPTIPAAGQYIAGLQVIHLVSGSNNSFPIILVVNGDGFLRLTGEPPRTFGTSYRVATHNVGASTLAGDPFNEDFPRIVQMATEVVDARRIRLSFLVDSGAFTGTLLCELVPGVESMMDVQATFIMRRDLSKGVEMHTGFAGMSSLFFQGAADTPAIASDQAHDADFLVLTLSDGSVTEFALRNPATPLSMDFVAPLGRTITSVVLEQRDRDPAHYATFASAAYASRSSLAIEQINASVPFKVTLQIFPASSEFFDNVVAHITILEDLKKGDVITLAYRLRAF